VRLEQPRHHPQRRGLARPVRPEQRIELTCAHDEIEPVDGRPIEALDEPANVEGGRRRWLEHAARSAMMDAWRDGRAGRVRRGEDEGESMWLVWNRLPRIRSRHCARSEAIWSSTCTRMRGAIASARYARLAMTAHAYADRDCFGVLRTPRNDGYAVISGAI